MISRCLLYCYHKLRMKLSWVQISFYYLFDVLLLLLFLFGESFLGVYVMGALGLFFLAFSPHLDFAKIKLYKTEFLLWLLFLFGLMISSFFTQNLPLTLNAINFYALALVVFVFFLLLKKSIFQVEFLLGNLLLVILGLALISFGFNLRLDLAEQLPGMNLLYATYGHNHLGALIIMALPLAWFFFAKQAQEAKKQSLFLIFLGTLIFLTISLILSFGRVVTLLGLVEMAVFCSLTFSAFKLKKIIKLILLGLVSGLVIIFLAKNTFTLATYFQQNLLCPLPLYKDQICKDVSSDLRLSYWVASVKTFVAQPLVGFGPGTHKLATELYKVRPDAGTSYAHNSFLQLLAEGGLVMGLPFMALVGYLMVKIGRNLRTIGRPGFIFKRRLAIFDYRFFVAVSLIASFLNGLVDFDWNFSGILVVNLILAVVLLRSTEAKSLLPIKFREAKELSLRIVQIVYFGVAVGLVSLAGLSLIVEGLIWRKKINATVEFFPYFQSHMQLFLDSPDLTNINQAKIQRLYANVPYLYLRDSQNYWSTESWDKLDQLAPWHFYEANATRTAIALDHQLLKSQLERTHLLYKQSQGFGYQGLVVANDNLSLLSVKLADDFLAQGDYDSATRFYFLATEFHQWVFNNLYPRFLFALSTQSEKSQFWEKMDQLPVQNFGKHSEAVGNIYLSLLRTAVDRRDWPKINLWLDRILEIAPWLINSPTYRLIPDLEILAGEGEEQAEQTLAKILSPSPTPELP